MLVVLSDLHFEEEASDHIPGQDGLPAVEYSRNLPADQFRYFIAQLATIARRSRATHLDLVLAGDIFDIHRTAIWFEEQSAGLRPYVDNDVVSPELEAVVLKILRGIAAEPQVAATLETFRRLSGGRYLQSKDLARDFPVVVQVHYVPGNHDRMANATPAIRREIRQLLGLPLSDEPFPHWQEFPRQRALVRHGHEYDRYNFARDLTRLDTIPGALPAEVYAAPTFGDFITIDVASRLPRLFREHHGDEAILGDPTLRALYLRLLEFDDLRPLRAMFNYLMRTGVQSMRREEIWRHVQPVVVRLLETIAPDAYLHGWLKRLNRVLWPDVMDAIHILLRLRPWRLLGLPLWFVEWLSQLALSSGRHTAAASIARREAAIQAGEQHYVIAGHTHAPQVALLATDGADERYYINTGTWRNRLPATPDFTAFGRTQAMTYLTAFDEQENRARAGVTTAPPAFQLWVGTAHGWSPQPGAMQPLRLR